jgi:hypothetical protein
MQRKDLSLGPGSVPVTKPNRHPATQVRQRISALAQQSPGRQSGETALAQKRADVRSSPAPAELRLRSQERSKQRPRVRGRGRGGCGSSSEMELVEELNKLTSAEGRNRKAVLCQRCGSRVLQPGTALFSRRQGGRLIRGLTRLLSPSRRNRCRRPRHFPRIPLSSALLA